jgi:hypothetical protein
MTDVLSWRIPRLVGVVFLAVTLFGFLVPVLVTLQVIPTSALEWLLIPGSFGAVLLVRWLMDEVRGPGEPAGPRVVLVAKVLAALLLGNWLYGFVNALLLSRYVFVLPSGASVPWPGGVINLLCIAFAFWGLSEAEKRHVF